MTSVVLSKLALATPLGLTAETTQAAIFGSITGFAETEVVHDDQPVRASLLPTLPPAASREDRMLFLGRRALADCAEGLGERGRIRGYLVLPERDGCPLEEGLVARGIAQSAPREASIDWTPPYRLGRAGFFHALNDARAAVASGQISMALVGGVDSHCDPASLHALAHAGRTLGPRNFDGLLPGEAAGFVRVTLRDGASYGEDRPFASVVALACARDDEPFPERSPMKAHALTAVFRDLRRAHPGPRPQHLYSCQSNEGRWGRELSNAYLRNVALMPEPFRQSLTAAFLGDTGAAAPFVALAMAARTMKLGHRTNRKVDTVVLYGAADEGAVGGAVVTRA